MIDKKELYCELDRIAYEILDEIVSPVCEIPKGSIWADIFAADIACYAFEEEEEQEIIKRICDKYKIHSICEGEFIAPFEPWWPLSLIALYILINGEAEHFTIDKKDLE